MGLSFYERRKLVDSRIGKRDATEQKRSHDHDSVYNCTRWHKLRDRMRFFFPICPDPFNVHGLKVVASKEVHHIVPLTADLSLKYDERNLIPLCQSCHRRADKMDEDQPQEQRSLMTRLRSHE